DTLLLRQFLDIDTRFTTKFLPSTYTGYCKQFSHKTLAFLSEIPGGIYTVIAKLIQAPMADTPDIANFEALQRLDALFLRINHAYTLISLVFLTITACHLCQSLCRSNAHCNRDACTLSDGLYNLPAVGNQFLSFSEA